MIVRPATESSPIDQLARVKPRPLSMTEAALGRKGPGFFPVERRNLPARQQLLNRIAAEFREMPGLRLTLTQARRLFGLPEDTCARILGSLVRDGLLRGTPEGTYGLRDDRP